MSSLAPFLARDEPDRLPGCQALRIKSRSLTAWKVHSLMDEMVPGALLVTSSTLSALQGRRAVKTQRSACVLRQDQRIFLQTVCKHEQQPAGPRT